jgi:flotillin
MAKKASLIDRESREVVADNGRAAMVAEIDAQRDVDVQAQQAAEQVGLRTAKKDQEVGIANEHANQAVQSEAKETRTREMAVKRVEVVRDAEIQKDAQVVAASQDKETIIIRANGDKQQKITIAEGILVEQQKHGEGVLAVGTAEAEAKRLDEMAVVSPQIKLAEEIGENEGYQTYLVSIRGVEKDEAIGTEAAKALQAADIKVISNTGNVQSGVNKVMDLFSSKGGTEIGAFVEALAQTEQGAALLERMNGGPGGGNSAAA